MKVNILKKHEDDRGWLTEVLRSDEIDEKIEQFCVATIKSGKIRGNHYHKRKVEWFCVIRGDAKLLLLNPVDEKKEEMILKGDELKTVEIIPGIAHAIKNIGTEDVYLVSAINEVFDPNDPDTYPLKILE